MKWFKHETGALKDEKIQSVIEQEGLTAYAVFFVVCELVAEKIKDGQMEPKITMSWRYVELLTRTRRTTIRRVLDECDAVGLLINNSITDQMIVEIPNLLKRLDNWTKRSVATTAESEEKLPLEEEKNKNKKKNKNKNSILYTPEFESIWKNYPNPLGKKEAFKHFSASVKSPKDLESCQDALEKYKKHLAENTWKIPQHGSTWFNNWQEWVNWREPKSEISKADELIARLEAK